MKFKLHIIWFLIWDRIHYALIHSELGIWFLIGMNKKRFLSNLRYSNFYSKYASFNELPLGNKSVLMDHFEEINIAGLKKDEAFIVGLAAEQGKRSNSMIGDITVGLSSGTSGNRGIFLVSNIERAKWVASILIRVIGVKLRKRRVAFFLRANNELYQSVKSSLISFTYFNIF